MLSKYLCGPAVLRNSGAATLVCATLFATFGLAAGQARATEDLVVKYDQSQILRLPRPAAEIIIGNASIADVTVQSGNLLVVTGKTFGITNMIILDAERNVIQDQRVVVQRDEHKIVNLVRGTARSTYNCTPQCNPSLVIGDDQTYFASINAISQLKTSSSEKSGDSGQQSSGQ